MDAFCAWFLGSSYKAMVLKTCSINIPWELGRDAGSWVSSSLAESESLGWGPKNLVFGQGFMLTKVERFENFCFKNNGPGTKEQRRVTEGARWMKVSPASSAPQPERRGRPSQQLRWTSIVASAGSSAI